MQLGKQHLRPSSGILFAHRCTFCPCTAGKFLGGKQDAQKPVGTGSPQSAVPQAQVGDPSTAPVIPTHAVPVWPLGIPLAMHVHLTTSPTGDVFSNKWTSAYRQDANAGLPSLVWENITFGDWNEKRVAEFTVNLPKVRNVLCFSSDVHGWM